MLPTEGREPKFIGRIGAELDLKTGLQAARLAALNALAVTRQALGSLDKVTRIVRLGVSVATREMFAINQRWPTVPRNCCLTSLEKTRTLTVYRWCRKPYARNASSSGSHFRGHGLKRARCRDTRKRSARSQRTLQHMAMSQVSAGNVE